LIIVESPERLGLSGGGLGILPPDFLFPPSLAGERGLGDEVSIFSYSIVPKAIATIDY
jgi:hypothetical protein